MPETTANLSLPYIQPSQAQKHVTHNEALRALDALTQLAVEQADLATPPASPVRGARYLVATGASGAWSGQEGAVALWDDVWHFHAPLPGWLAYDRATGRLLVWDGMAWVEAPDFNNLDQVGVNTGADNTNRLAVASDASLFSHDGAGHQMKLNKAADTDTAALLFQTGWSGRAEMGTAGSDDFSIKLSDDGSSWITALGFDRTTGLASGAAVQSAPTDTGAGKLARADYAYGPGNLLGTVSETAGQPTGAVIERASNANGDYVRFADGTQICWSPTFIVDVNIAVGALYRSGTVDWYFPAVFADSPAMSQARQNNASVYWTVPGRTFATYGDACAFSYQSITGRAINLVAIGRWF